jgi:SAM-dependent methyltransferase
MMGAALRGDQDFEGYAVLKPFNDTVAPGWSDAFEESMTRIGKPVSDVRMLDFGCGDGKYFGYLTKRGLAPGNIHGLDVSKIRVERCQQRGWAQARVLSPGAPLPYADGTFDLVNMMEVIEHIPAADGKRVIEEIRRVLRPGGILLISTPNYPIKHFYDVVAAVRTRKLSRVFDDPTHVTLFNKVRLETLLQPMFGRLDSRPFKEGFLYVRYPRPFLRHKLFFICQV